MAAVAVRVGRASWRLAAIGMAAALASCSGENWKWDWWNQDTAGQPKQKPVTQAQGSPSDQKIAKKDAPAKTPAKQEAPRDPQSDELQAKVDRYVRAMSASDDGSRGYNDFNSKIERQQDPNRKSRVRKVAERGQEAPVGSVAPSPDSTAGKVKQPQENDRAVSADHDRGKEPEAPRPTELTQKPRSQEQPVKSDMGPALEDRTQTKHASGASEEHKDAEKLALMPKSAPAVMPPGADADQKAGAADKPEGASETEKEPAQDAPEPQTAGRAPVLSQVTVAAGPEPDATTPKTGEETQAGANLPEQAKPSPNVPSTPAKPVDTFQTRLAAQEAVVAKAPDSLAEQYKLRLMYLVDGQDDKALAEAKGLDAESQQILQAQVRAFISARSGTGRDPAARATEMLEPIDELRNQLRNKADLHVSRVILCTKIEAFGMYEPIDPPQFAAGRKNPVLVYIEVDNFKSEKTASGFYRTLLSVRPSLLNRSGEELWSANYENIEDLSRQRRQDFFLTVNEVLPGTLTPGEYTLKIEVEDVLAGKINGNTAKFKIAP